MGQDETVLLTHGALLAASYGLLLFDVHTYEHWFQDSDAAIRARLQALKSVGVAVIVGEVGPSNAGNLMSPWPLLAELEGSDIGVAAWMWGCRSSASDFNKLQRCDGLNGGLNDEGNHAWGSGYLDYTQRRWRLSLDTSTEARTDVLNSTGVPSNVPTGIPTEALTDVPTSVTTGAATVALSNAATDTPTGVPTFTPSVSGSSLEGMPCALGIGMCLPFKCICGGGGGRSLMFGMLGSSPCSCG